MAIGACDCITNEEHDVKDLVMRMNIQRIPYVAGFFLLFQLVKAFFPVTLTDYTLLGYCSIGIVNSVALVMVLLFQKDLKDSKESCRRTFYFYWCLLFLASIPYIISDIQLYSANKGFIPYNIIFLLGIFINVPIIETRHFVLLNAVLFLVNNLLAVLFHADTRYYLFLICISFGLFAFSYIVRFQYLKIIKDLKQESYIDPLTGLFNRRAGLDKLSMILDFCKRTDNYMAVYMIDIDHFKDYNDVFGHMQGDLILKRIAKAISLVFCRKSDVVFRYGGEEFVVGIIAKNPQFAREMGEQLLTSVRELSHKNGKVSDVATVSAGFSLYDPTVSNVKDDAYSYINKADIAMYSAKNKGRNTIIEYQE